MNYFEFPKCVIAGMGRTDKFYLAQAYSKMPNEKGIMENITLTIWIVPEVMEWKNLKGEQPKMDMVQKGKSIGIAGTTIHDVQEVNGQKIMHFNVLVNNRQGITYPKKDYQNITKLLDADIVSEKKPVIESQKDAKAAQRFEILGKYSHNGRKYNIILSCLSNDTSLLIHKNATANFHGTMHIRRNSKDVPFLVIDAELAVSDSKVVEKYLKLEGLDDE